jgi:poly-gamma-glutamate synthase PgsB/CapB
MSIIVALTGVVLVGFSLEAILVRLCLRSIPVRVHVNGTRGKSSVTRYIAAALRAEGRCTLAKITGIRPALILPDGREELLRRRGPARMQEQVRLLFHARRLRCDALVLECMSIAPLLQERETMTIRPTLSVLTNIRDDHREEMGESDAERSAALCLSIPFHATLVSLAIPQRSTVEEHAHACGTRVVYPPADILPSAIVLPVHVHPENVMLALTVCRELGLDPQSALAAVLAEAGRGESPLIEFSLRGRTLRFLDGFAVNDVPSAEGFLARWHAVLGGWDALAVLLNTRADRPLRSMVFARWCASRAGVVNVVLTGTHVPATRRALVASGFNPARIHCWTREQVRNPGSSLHDILLPGGTLVAGFGNIAGDGFTILQGLRA